VKIILRDEYQNGGYAFDLNDGKQWYILKGNMVFDSYGVDGQSFIVWINNKFLFLSVVAFRPATEKDLAALEFKSDFEEMMK
jgi:hypothetical protein